MARTPTSQSAFSPAAIPPGPRSCGQPLPPLLASLGSPSGVPVLHTPTHTAALAAANRACCPSGPPATAVSPAPHQASQFAAPFSGMFFSQISAGCPFPHQGSTPALSSTTPLHPTVGHQPQCLCDTSGGSSLCSPTVDGAASRPSGAPPPRWWQKREASKHAVISGEPSAPLLFNWKPDAEATSQRPRERRALRAHDAPSKSTEPAESVSHSNWWESEAPLRSTLTTVP